MPTSQDTPRRLGLNERVRAYVHYWRNPKRTPILLHEIPPALAMLAQGLTWALPGNTFGTTTAFRLMGDIAPEAVWGVAWTFWAILWLVAILSRREPPRRFCTLIGGLSFAAVGLLMFASNGLSSFAFPIAATSAATWINYLNLGSAGVLENSS